MTTQPICCGCCLNPWWVENYQHYGTPAWYVQPTYTNEIQYVDDKIKEPVDFPQIDYQPLIQDGIQFGEIKVPGLLTEEEKEILKSLGDAWNKFLTLPNRSEADNSEYLDAIHRCQQLIGLRVARRVNPEVWLMPE